MSTRISVIIPARNEAAQIGGTVRAAVAAAALLGDGTGAGAGRGNGAGVEILVVDSGSTDATAARAREACGGHGVRIVSAPRPGAARARNVGAREASGDVLVFVDADTRVPADGLARVRHHVEHGRYGAGIFRLRAPAGRCGVRARCWWGFWNQVRRLPLARAKAMPAFMFCTREVFERFGPFDERMAIGEEWPILAGLYRHDRRRLVYDRSVAAETSGRRMEMQRFGYVRTYARYAAAVVWPRARVDYTDRIREAEHGAG